MSITIKQAFEKLAMVTGAAVKNPWFVGRNLNQAFADIAENIEGGGSGSSSYSTDEHVVGKWIDGITDVYEKTFVKTDLAKSGDAFYISESFTSENFDTLIDAGGIVSNASKTSYCSLTGIAGVNDWQYGIHITNTGIMLYTTVSASVIVGGTCILTIRYLKAS